MSRSDDKIRFDSDDLNLINMFSFTCRIVHQETKWERGANSDRAESSSCQAAVILYEYTVRLQINSFESKRIHDFFKMKKSTASNHSPSSLILDIRQFRLRS